MSKGIDVSAYQGIIDWEKAKAGGVEFAIIRAGWGIGAVDKSFKYNADMCTKLNIPFGAYWFIYATTVEQARQNALACLKTIRKYNLVYPVCADLEYDSVSYAAKCGVVITKDLASAMVKTFLDTVKAAGYKVANYTNLDYYKRYFNADVNSGYPMWFAYWGAANKTTSGAELWQYTSKGKAPGIVGNVDMDVDNANYATANRITTPEEAKAAQTQPQKEYYNIPAVYTLVFDPDYYLEKYTDLQAAVAEWIRAGVIRNEPGAIAWQLYQHFLLFGMNEARQGNRLFDARKYKAAYTDLQAAFGDPWKPYYYHYMMYGAKEIATGQRKNFA